MLTLKDDKKAQPAQQSLPFNKPATRPADPYEAGGVVYMTQPLDRPEALPGKTYKVKWPDSEHAIYITLNDVIQDGRRRPFEVFINSKNTEHYAWTVALTRMISAVFRRGGDVSFVVEELKAVFDPRGGQWMGGRYVPSLAGGDRRSDRAAHDRYRLPRAGRHGRRGRRPDPDGDDRGLAGGHAGDDGGAGGRVGLRQCGRKPRGAGGECQRQRHTAHAAMPEMRQPVADPPGRLRQLHELRVYEVRVSW